MANRFAGQYGDYVSRIKGMANNTRDPKRDAQNEQKRKDSQFWGNLASGALPVIGGIAGGALGTFALPGLGTAAGASMGAGLGNMAGQAAGQHFYNEGEAAMDDTRKREMERMALMQAIMGMR